MIVRIIENFSFGLVVSLHWVGYYLIIVSNSCIICESFLCVIEKTFCTIVYNNSQEFHLRLRYGKNLANINTQ